MEAVRELRRCVTEQGFKGVRVIPWLWEAPPTDRRYYPLFDRSSSSRRSGSYGVTKARVSHLALGEHALCAVGNRVVCRTRRPAKSRLRLLVRIGHLLSQ